jgi:hypothetical protein
MEVIGYGGGIDTGEIQSVAWTTPEEARRDLARRLPPNVQAERLKGGRASF